MVLILLATLLVLAAFQPQPGVAQEGFDLLVFPAKLELGIAPGATQEFDINVHNYLNTDEQLDVYFMDYLIKPNNEFVFMDPGYYSYSCATWLSTDTPSMTVPAGQVVQKRFTVTVPVDAEPGGHYGVIFFQRVGPAAEGPIKTTPRIGSLIMVTVPGEIVRDAIIESVSVNSTWFWPSGKIPLLPKSVTTCRVVVFNKGNVHLTMKAKLTYTPKFGWGSGTIDLGEITVLPDTRRHFEEVIPDPPFLGSYEVKAEVSYGPSLFEFDTTKTMTATFNNYPLSLLLIPLVLVALVITVMWITRRKRGKKDRVEEEDKGGKEEKEDEPQPEERWTELSAEPGGDAGGEAGEEPENKNDPAGGGSSDK